MAISINKKTFIIKVPQRLMRLSSTKASSGMQKVKDNKQAHNHGYAPLYSLRKYLKEVENVTRQDLHVTGVPPTTARAPIS